MDTSPTVCAVRLGSNRWVPVHAHRKAVRGGIGRNLTAISALYRRDAVGLHKAGQVVEMSQLRLLMGIAVVARRQRAMAVDPWRTGWPMTTRSAKTRRDE